MPPDSNRYPLRALIIEDSEDDCQFLIHFLKKRGFNLQFQRIQSEAEMNQALAHNQWDIILSDYSMPKFSGPAAFEILKKSGRDIPFIIISGTVGEDIAVENMRSGVSDYILKSNLHRLEPAIKRELEAAKSRARHHETKMILTATEEQLRQSQKMEAIGQLAGGIAHDFNNMLSVMQIYCHKIREITHDSQVKNYVDKILSVHSKTIALTKQLLIFSRRQATSASPLQLNQVIINIKEMLESLVGKKINLQFDLDGSLNLILGNESQLEQIIINLLVNARYAISEKGHIYVKTSTEIVQAPKAISSTTLTSQTYCVLEVQDTGTGIDPENLKRIFEPFFTTKPADQGTGLGLSIIYGIVHQANGGIDVKSALGKGTTFRIYLPSFDGPTVINDIQNEELSSKSLNRTILLVEDEQELKTLISEILTQEGYQVIETADGEEALEILKDPQNKIDLVLTDMMMPKISGAMLFEQSQKTSSHIPFIYMSGYFKEQPSGSFIFLEKPFSNQALVDKIKSVLGSK
jgi:signal transduction histidine kinase